MKNNLKKLIAENNANIEEVAKETGIGNKEVSLLTVVKAPQLS